MKIQHILQSLLHAQKKQKPIIVQSIKHLKKKKIFNQIENHNNIKIKEKIYNKITINKVQNNNQNNVIKNTIIDNTHHSSKVKNCSIPTTPKKHNPKKKQNTKIQKEMNAPTTSTTKQIDSESSYSSDYDSDSDTISDFDESHSPSKSNSFNLPSVQNESIDVQYSHAWYKSMVRTNIWVFWPIDDVYYHGIIAKYKRNHIHRKRKTYAPLFIQYDDGDKEWLNLQTERWSVKQPMGNQDKVQLLLTKQKTKKKKKNKKKYKHISTVIENIVQHDMQHNKAVFENNSSSDGSISDKSESHLHLPSICISSDISKMVLQRLNSRLLPTDTEIITDESINDKSLLLLASNKKKKLEMQEKNSPHMKTYEINIQNDTRHNIHNVKKDNDDKYMMVTDEQLIDKMQAIKIGNSEHPPMQRISMDIDFNTDDSKHMMDDEHKNDEQMWRSSEMIGRYKDKRVTVYLSAECNQREAYAEGTVNHCRYHQPSKCFQVQIELFGDSKDRDMWVSIECVQIQKVCTSEVAEIGDYVVVNHNGEWQMNIYGVIQSVVQGMECPVFFVVFPEIDNVGMFFIEDDVLLADVYTDEDEREG